MNSSATVFILLFFATVNAELFHENEEGRRQFLNLVQKTESSDDSPTDISQQYYMTDSIKQELEQGHSNLKRDATDSARNVRKYVDIRRGKVGRNSVSKHNGQRNKKGSINKKHIRTSFLANKKYKKADVFVIDQSELDANDFDDANDVSENENQTNQGVVEDSQEDAQDNQDDVQGNQFDEVITQDVTGDRKGTINHAAEEIVVDEDNHLNNDLTSSPTHLESNGNNVIADSLKDGLSTQFLESNQMIKENEIKGNYVPYNIPAKSAVTNNNQFQDGLQQGPIESSPLEPDDLALAKAIEKQSSSPIETHPNQLNFLTSTTSPSDPAISRAISTDNIIDKSISKAISEQMKSDSALSQRMANQEMGTQTVIDSNTKATTNTNKTNTLGDFANIVEQASDADLSQSQNIASLNGLKPNNIYSPIANEKPSSKILENFNDKLLSPFSNFDRIGQTVLKKEPADYGLEVKPSLSSLSPSEQQLISSIDNAVRSKDVTTEAATKIMMPMKEDTLSDRAVAPSEQLLDMLAKGKFNNPLPDDMLSKLSTFDPNKMYLQEEGISSLQNPAFLATKFAKVGSEYIPVHDVSINMPKTTPKPLIDPQQLAHAETLMKTNPAFLAQNNEILDGSKYHTIQDLTNIGEAIFPGHVVDIKLPMVPPETSHRVLQRERKPLAKLPTNIAQLLEQHSKEQNIHKSFEDAISDSPSRNTVDHFVPQKVVRVAEEKKGESQCHWNPCLNGGFCTAHPDKYHCSCKPGWIGENCEKRSNCFPNPCHHGVCSPNADGFTCTCKLGYKGTQCDILDRCHPNPCNSNGICTETFRGVQCECAPGFKGRLCELEAKCAPINPCLNGGVCREFADHYYCSCLSGFRGQNCETFISPTKAPPTVPIKHEGPQAIPAPVNVASNEIHEIITTQFVDKDGKIISSSHANVETGNENMINSGANLVPHPSAVHTPQFESHNPFESQNHFIGAPSADDKFIFHSADEDKQTKVIETTENKNKSVTGVDDRYQTHIVEVSKNNVSSHDVHVGKAIPETGDPISLGNPHPENDQIDKVLTEEKLHREKALDSEDHSHHVDNQIHVINAQPHTDLHLNEVHGFLDTQSVVVNNAAHHPQYDHTEKGTERSLVNKTPNETDATLKPNTEIHQETQKHTVAQSNTLDAPVSKQDIHQVVLTLPKEAKQAKQKAKKVISEINHQIQNKISQNKQMQKLSFVKQKSAYAAWRRKALLNYHKRNPDKPLPRNTVSLSKNSLCPGFCRLFCDPWCVKIGCCKITKDELDMFKNIEAQHENNLLAPGKVKEISMCNKCSENADCVNKKCLCKTGFHGDGITCSIDNCLLCHLDADCGGDRCVCKKGFFGDGYECKDKKYQKTLCSRCHPKADCIGGDCLCTRGFYGNGRSCWPLPII